MFKKLLFATTASPTCDNAARVAFDLELKWDAKLFVFHVLGIPSRGFSSYVTDVRTGEAEQVWPRVLEDARQGNLKRRYDGGLAQINGCLHAFDCIHRVRSVDLPGFRRSPSPQAGVWRRRRPGDTVSGQT